MKNNFVITIILILVLTGAVIFLLPKNNNGNLVNPMGNFMQKQPSLTPQVSNYNPPKEVKYDSSTDLKAELDNVNPKVLNSDFDPLY